MAYHRRKRRQDSFFSLLVVIIAFVWALLTKGGQKPVGNNLLSELTGPRTTRESGTLPQVTPAKKDYGGLSDKDYRHLASLNFKSGDKAYVLLNHDHATLIKNAWRTNRVLYSNLDRLNRTSRGNTAFLEKRNVASDQLRVRQFIQPTGWHYNHRNGVQLYNRGHLIAYSVSAGIDQEGHYRPQNPSGDQNNPKNLFTQSAFSNQKVQTIFESKVRQALEANKKVIYQATPIFRGNDLMARGINLQAVSTDGSLDFNVYLYNVQPGFVFNYRTGQAKVDHAMRVQE